MANEITYKSADEFKTKIELYSGKLVTIDLMAITEKEWRTLFSQGTDEETESKILCKVTDLTAEEIASLKKPEFKQLVEALLNLGLTPAANPH